MFAQKMFVDKRILNQMMVLRSLLVFVIKFPSLPLQVSLLLFFYVSPADVVNVTIAPPYQQHFQCIKVC